MLPFIQALLRAPAEVGAVLPSSRHLAHAMAQVAAVAARQVDLPEVVIQQLPTREYPEGGMAAHLFGYVGQIQENQLQRPEFAKLETGAMIGQTGVERSYGSLLRGSDGFGRLRELRRVVRLRLAQFIRELLLLLVHRVLRGGAFEDDGRDRARFFDAHGGLFVAVCHDSLP